MKAAGPMAKLPAKSGDPAIILTLDKAEGRDGLVLAYKLIEYCAWKGLNALGAKCTIGLVLAFNVVVQERDKSALEVTGLKIIDTSLLQVSTVVQYYYRL